MTKKRFLSIFVALCLSLVMLPATALAEEDIPAEAEVQPIPVEEGTPIEPTEEIPTAPVVEEVPAAPVEEETIPAEPEDEIPLVPETDAPLSQRTRICLPFGQMNSPPKEPAGMA